MLQVGENVDLELCSKKNNFYIMSNGKTWETKNNHHHEIRVCKQTLFVNKPKNLIHPGYICRVLVSRKKSCPGVNYQCASVPFVPILLPFLIYFQRLQ